ncbi:MAG: CapA family protein [Candidatus Tectomicrobia bacterium]|nr:CapA family protein [Candidatus Tectomicrobia bacterium]
MQNQGSHLTLAATGDALITRRFSMYKEDQFLGLIDLLRKVDVAFTNLEMLFHTYEEGFPALESGGTYMAADPVIAEDLKWAGFNLFATANNHTYDYADGGMLSTMAVLDKLGLVYAGTGRNLLEARGPAYLDTPQGRVALISMASTFPAAAQAGEQRPDMKGRPGLNPLRFEERYAISQETMEKLKQLSETLGLEEAKRQRMAIGFERPPEDPNVFEFLKHKFVVGEKPEIRTTVHKGDAEGNLRWIRDARRQADWVLVSLHSHESEVRDKEVSAEFIPPFARSCIDAGADAFIGHGPHLLRGIEIYNKKPIFYSLGNFVFQNETVTRLPSDIYEKFRLDPYKSTPADVFDARALDEKGELKGFPADSRYWESVVATCTFKGRDLSVLDLYPITLGYRQPRSVRGRPFLADDELGHSIIQRLAKLSEPYGTTIEFQEGRGVVRL